MVELMSLGDICYISDYVSNGSFASLRENVHYKSEPDYAVLLRVVDYSCGFDKSKFVYIDEHAYNFLSKSSLEGGEIIMSNVGSCGLLFRCPKLDKKMSLAPNAILIKSKYIDYLFYWLGSKFGQEEIKKITSKSAMPKFNKTEFKKIRVPIPSLSEQNRIVGILENFTSVIENLKQQIAERRKQYEYYRDQLLDLEVKEGVEMKKLGEIGKCVAGATPSTKERSYWDNGNISWMSSGEVHQGIVRHTASFITQKGYDNASTKMLPIGTVVIALAGQGKTRGSVAITAIELCTNQSLCGVVINDKNIINKYIYFYLKTRYDELRRISSGEGTRGGLNLKMISSYSVPILPLHKQTRIVSILDTFEASIANLEAQLKLREKQYEYYRNKLLTFE